MTRWRRWPIAEPKPSQPEPIQDSETEEIIRLLTTATTANKLVWKWEETYWADYSVSYTTDFQGSRYQVVMGPGSKSKPWIRIDGCIFKGERDWFIPLYAEIEAQKVRRDEFKVSSTKQNALDELRKLLHKRT